METLSSAALCAAFLAPACGVFGGVATTLRLPSITGFLVAGVVAGPHVLGLLSISAVRNLWFIDQICLSVIALAAGAELQWENMDKIRKQVFMVTLAISVASWLGVYAAMLPLTPYIPMLTDMAPHHRQMVCSLCATLMVARSPASAIAVLQESGGRGTFSTLSLTVVIVKDVLTIVAFAVNIEVARALFAPGATQLSAAALAQPLVSVLAAIAIGAAAAALFTSLFRTALPGPRHLAFTGRTIAVVALASATFQAASFLEAEPLLACAVAGLLAANTLREGRKEDFHAVLGAAMPRVNLAFFSLAGASLRLGALAATLQVALGIAAARLVAIAAGSYAGCWASGAAPQQRRIFWQSMVTQAGVALGLARMVAVRFPDWGPHFQTLMAAVIIVNLCVGPPLFRHAILAAGEGRGQHRDDSLHGSPAPPADAAHGLAVEP